MTSTTGVPIAELRGSHKGGERVKDSVLALMRTIVEVPVTGRNGLPATKLVPLLSDTTVSDDDENPTGEVVYLVLQRACGRLSRIRPIGAGCAER